MGDRGITLAKAKKELEDLYLGVPDESVNLTFQDFAQVRHNQNQNQNQNNAEIKKLSPSSAMSPIAEKSKSPLSSPLPKLPSLDFSKGFPSPHHHHHHHLDMDQRSMMYDDMSVANYGVERGGRRRPGIPHSNICALCCNYIYICRHRCLVCGRVYCRQCVNTGMGDMTEGRKCTDCLGRRFSQRYIHRAGNIGWCMVYPSVMKQQELKWAERGPRRSGDNMRRRSPVPSGTPSRHHTSNPPSFVMNSPMAINHHPMPF
ncbi:uncharacterized protein LOC121744162 [Salvia splendens]|uniref:uncharacterized protein LOC121744162 n=1 Tax=Salvia splendens TaxID=180675 RepID=UPI001C28085F|nr:uncharacterized protein LOC121744162 [Salvia splendens]